MFYGPPGTGKTLCALAVANRTDACFIRVIGSELVQKYVGEGARMVRELFELARTKKACLIFFDEIDAVGGARFDDGMGGRTTRCSVPCSSSSTSWTGFDPEATSRWVSVTDVCCVQSVEVVPLQVIMATNRPDTLDPALVRPGRIDRRIEFGLCRTRLAERRSSRFTHSR